MLLKSYSHAGRHYVQDLLAYRVRTNLIRLRVFGFLGIFVSLFAVVFVHPKAPHIDTLFYSMVVFSLLSVVFSSILIKKNEDEAPRLKLRLIRLGVFFLVLWATVQLFLGGEDPRGFITYIGLVIAIASVFSLEPLYYLVVCVLSLASLFLLPGYFPALSTPHIDGNFLFLVNSVIFAWLVSVMHFYTVLEIFFVKMQMREEARRAELALEGGNLGYWNWDIPAETIDVDARWSAMLGYEAKRRRIGFDEFFRLVVPEDRKRVAETVQAYFDGKVEQYTITFRMETQSGEEKWIYAEGSVTEWSGDGKPLHMHGIHQDIQELREQQRKLQESELRFRAYTENAPVGVFIIQGLRFTYVNPEAIRIAGYTEEELLNSINLYTLVHPEERKKLLQDMRGLLRDNTRNRTYFYRIISKTRSTHWFETRLSTVNWKKRIFLLSAVDITERRRAEERLKEYATYDELTGVFNRRVGLTLLEKEMDRVKRDGGVFTLCFIDLNGLKIVNDTYGHEEGDELIRTVVGIVEDIMRSGDILCRLGGDEFLLLFRDCDMDNAGKIKARMETKFDEINRGKNKVYEVSVSYGLFEYSKETRGSVPDILHVADQRMYADKQERKAQREARSSSI